MKALKKKRKINIKIIVTVILAVLLLLFVIAVITWKTEMQKREKISQGIKYLEQLEKQDVSLISDNIKSVNSELNFNLVEGDNVDAIWRKFDNAVILGDSRAVGFYYHEFLPQERVLAKGGGKITDVDEYIEQLQKLNPEQIFLCFGLNDVGIGFWPEPEDYVKEYKKHVELLNEKLPDTDVYINSILPAIGVGLDADPDYVRIEDYNEALEKMAEDNEYYYINNTKMANDHQDLYQEDGLHVQKEFYKYWAANMLSEVEE